MSDATAPRDLTRFNRSGLARVAYVDANAASLLERLRHGLATQFPEWDTVRAEVQDDPGIEQRRMLQQYLDHAPGREDMLWQLTRSFARAMHVLAGTLDAYANEGWIGTATEWESLRRLVAMLDYAPHPAASAYTPIALTYKAGTTGTVMPGLQVRHTPADGGAPVVFETLEPQRGDAGLNLLQVEGHDRNPCLLTGHRLVLEGKHDKIRNGDAMVLEDERTGRSSAHVVRGATVEAARTIVEFHPPVQHCAPYEIGWLRVHAAPKERLAVKGPLAAGSQPDRALQLGSPAEGLAPGDIVVIGRPGAKPAYRRIKRIGDDGRQLVFHQRLGSIDLQRATVMRPVAVPITRREGQREIGAEARLQFYRVAGDWTRLLGLWLADIRVIRKREYLATYECMRAEYTPVRGAHDPETAGYTIIGLAWTASEDGVALPDGEPSLPLANPQSLLAPPPGPSALRPDPYLQESDHGTVAQPVTIETPRHMRAGDWAVLVRGARVASTLLRSVEIDEAVGQARLFGTRAWQTPPEHGSRPFFLSSTRVHGHFTVIARAEHWSRNNTPLSGEVRLVLDTCPAALRRGLSLLAAGAPGDAMRTAVETWTESTRTLVLRDPLPRGVTAGNLRLLGNVVLAGHGETQPDRILGSGDATRGRQAFVFDASSVSFVADATMPAGVRADVQVHVGDERWTQVGNLNDSGPADAHYQVKVREDGRLLVEFGDGANARRLPTGANNVRIGWRQGVGAQGNLAAGSLTALVHPHALLAGFEQPIAAAGGASREGAESLRNNAAASTLAMERAVSLEDFSRLLRSHAAVAQARAIAPSTGFAREDRVEVRVVPAGRPELTEELRAQLERYLAEHAASGIAVTVRGYVPVPIKLDVAVRARRDAFDPDLVAARVRAALIAAFGIERRGLGQPLYRGEVFAVVERVPGVENSTCFVEVSTAAETLAKRVARDSGGVVLAVVPRPEQCVHLPDRNPDIEVRVEDYSL